MTASDFGVVGNGIADDAQALQALLNAAAKAGASIVLGAKTRIRVGRTIAVPSNTRLNGNGATLANSTSGKGGRIFLLRHVNNISIENLNFDGEKAAFSSPTEHRHNLVLAGAINVTLNQIHSYNAKGDGLYIGDQTNGPSINVVVTNSVFEQNHRQGMSVTCVSGLTVTNCGFRSSAGTAPEAGVDIEPNTDNSVIERIAFQSCTFMNNLGPGLLVALRSSPSVRQEAGTYTDCSFVQNWDSGVILNNSRGAHFYTGEMSRNGLDGMTIRSAVNTSVDSMVLTANARCGVRASGSYSMLTISRSVLDSNGPGASSTYFGIDSSPSAGREGVQLQVTETTYQNMHGGLRTNAASSYVSLAKNRYTNLAVNRVLADASVTRSDQDNPSPRPQLTVAGPSSTKATIGSTPALFGQIELAQEQR